MLAVGLKDVDLVDRFVHDTLTRPASHKPEEHG
jgi:hypothetical protein